MSINNRLKRLEKRTGCGKADPMAVMREAHQRTRDAFLARIPADLAGAVAELLTDEYAAEQLSSWILWPLARWATPPADWMFPRELVLFWLTAPHEFFAGHNCGRCGLAVPLLVHSSNDPKPPSIIVFPECPACGGVTSFAAGSGPQPESEVPHVAE